jgi:hypothetical protein
MPWVAFKCYGVTHITDCINDIYPSPTGESSSTSPSSREEWGRSSSETEPISKHRQVTPRCFVELRRLGSSRDSRRVSHTLDTYSVLSPCENRAGPRNPLSWEGFTRRRGSLLTGLELFIIILSEVEWATLIIINLRWGLTWPICRPFILRQKRNSLSYYRFFIFIF